MPRRLDPRRDAALVRHLRAHHDVVGRDDLVAMGIAAGLGNAEVAARRWQRIHEGTYCAHTGPLTFEQRCAAALLAAGPRSVLDGPSAATLHGLAGYDDGRVHVVVPHGTSIRRLAGVTTRQSSVLGERSRRDRDGLRAVRPEWAALTIARHTPWRARAVFAATVQQGLARADHLEGCVLAVGRFRGRPFVAAALRDVTGGTRSALEGAFLDAVRSAGLPLPVRNFPLVVDGRRVWLDACWPHHGLAVEIDGKAYHVLGEDWEHDLDRQNTLVLSGLTVLRFTARAVYGAPCDVAAQVRQALIMSNDERSICRRYS